MIAERQMSLVKIKNSVSFNVDHSKLNRGVYLSRIDKMGDIYTVTLDLRVRVPYKEEVVSNMNLHTFEHCFATAVRNLTDEMENVAVSYFGPMGCQTGYYLVLNTTEEKDRYFDLFSDILEKSCIEVEKMAEVPAKNELQCGNCYSLGEINDAIESARELKMLVEEMKEMKNFHQYKFID